MRCLDAPVSTLLLPCPWPCRHVSLCGECSQALLRCPICRSDIAERIEVYAYSGSWVWVQLEMSVELGFGFYWVRVSF